MIIKFTNYSDGIHQIEFSKKVEELDLEDPFINNVLLSCKMDKSRSQIYLSCDLSVEAHLTCDRCNAEFDRIFSNHFDSIYLFSKDEDKPDEIGVYLLHPDSDKIDLTEDVVEYTKLSLPMKILCSEDCKGLCARCGANLNEEECKCSDDQVSDVWEPLKKLKKN
ncbi:MAG: DUF177 domain-containing protein [Melioribacteraceae bacterium]|nr:DUF177 domain-containing protein [Melioribacteraceae bacterium]